MSYDKEDEQRSERELKKFVENEEYRDEQYKDVSDEFLPAEVDVALAKFENNELTSEDFFELSKSHQKIFIDWLSKNYSPKLIKSA